MIAFFIGCPFSGLMSSTNERSKRSHSNLAFLSADISFICLASYVLNLFIGAFSSGERSNPLSPNNPRTTSGLVWLHPSISTNWICLPRSAEISVTLFPMLTLVKGLSLRADKLETDVPAQLKDSSGMPLKGVISDKSLLPDRSIDFNLTPISGERSTTDAPFRLNFSNGNPLSGEISTAPFDPLNDTSIIEAFLLKVTVALPSYSGLDFFSSA